jgi:hypothetical protein
VFPVWEMLVRPEKMTWVPSFRSKLSEPDVVVCFSTDRPFASCRLPLKFWTKSVPPPPVIEKRSLPMEEPVKVSLPAAEIKVLFPPEPPVRISFVPPALNRSPLPAPPFRLLLPESPP